MSSPAKLQLQRMRLTFSTVVAAAIIFVAGFASCAGSYWLLKKYVYKPKITEIFGVLQFQDKPKPTNATDSLGYPPSSYFVKSTASNRFYVRNSLTKQ